MATMNQKTPNFSLTNFSYDVQLYLQFNQPNPSPKLTFTCSWATSLNNEERYKKDVGESQNKK